MSKDVDRRVSIYWTELDLLRRKAAALDWIQANNPKITMLPPYWQIETTTYVTLRPTLLEACEDAMRDEP